LCADGLYFDVPLLRLTRAAHAHLSQQAAGLSRGASSELFWGGEEWAELKSNARRMARASGVYIYVYMHTLRF